MTYTEVRERLEDWYDGHDVNISPEVLSVCYDAIVRVMNTPALLESIIQEIEEEKAKDKYKGDDDYYLAGVDTGFEDAIAVIRQISKRIKEDF